MFRKIITTMLCLALSAAPVSNVFAQEQNVVSMKCDDYASDPELEELCLWFETELMLVQNQFEIDIAKAREQRDIAKGQAKSLQNALRQTEQRFLEAELAKARLEESRPSRLVWFGLGVGTTIVGVLAVFIALR